MMKYKNTIKLWGQRLLLSLLFVILLYLIYQKVFAKEDWQAQALEVWKHAKDFNPLLLIFVLLLSLSNWSLEAKRWQVLLEKIQQISWVKAFQSIISGISFAIITPNKLGDFAGRIIYLPENKRISGALSTLIGGWAQTSITFFFGILGLIYFNIKYPTSWSLIVLIAGILFSIFSLWVYFNFSKLSKFQNKFKQVKIIKILFWTLKRFEKQQLMKILGISAIRFLIYNLQFALIAYILGVHIPFLDALFLIPLMYWLITVIPSFFLADIGIRSYISYLVFIESGLIQNDIGIISASLGIWLLNVILPALIGLVFIGGQLIKNLLKGKDIPS